MNDRSSAVREVDVLVERDAELAQLSAVAAEAAGGRARLVVVSGEAGIGKTTLWSAFLDTLPAGWQIEAVAGDLTDRSWVAPFAHLVSAAGERGETARSLASSVAAALSVRLATGPVVLVVDDLQFLDPMAVRALHHLVVQVPTRPLLVLTTYRLGAHPPTSPTSRAVADLAGAPWATEVRLAPLSLAGTTDLLARETGLRDAERAATLHDRTGGNPFFLTQLLGVPTDALPWTVGEAVAARLEALDDKANELASVLAVAGGPVPKGVVAELPSDIPAGAARLVHSGLALDDHPGVRLRHGLVADAIRAGLDAPATRRAHGALADALQRSPAATPESLARHLLAAGDADAAAKHAAEAADRLMTGGDFAAALEMYELALRRAPEGDPATVWLRRRATAAATSAGTHLSAAGAPSAAPGWGTPTLEPARRRSASAAPATLSAAVAEAHAAVAAGLFEKGATTAREAVVGARGTGDVIAGVEAALALLYSGEHAEAELAMAELASVASAAGRHGDVAAAQSGRARVLLTLGEFKSATRAQALAVEAARLTGDPLVLAGALVTAAVFEVIGGDLRAAERFADEAVATGDFVAQLAVKMPRALLALERDDLQSARTSLDELLPVARAVDLPSYRWPVLLASVMVEVEAGDTVRAELLLDEAATLLFSPYQENQADYLGLRGEAAFVDGDRDGVERHLHALAELARSVPGPHNLATADHLAGRLDSVDGEHARAAHHASSAARTWERAGRWISAASAWTDAAREHVLAGTDPREALTRAEELSRERGLVLRARKAAAVRAELGSDVPSVLAGLSARERDVVLLAAERRTNREIADELYLSEKTVRNYLSSAFAKLGVGRRSEIRQLLVG